MAKKKHPGGRPLQDPSGAKQTISIRLAPSELAWLRGLGGTAAEGLRRLVRESMGR